LIEELDKFFKRLSETNSRLLLLDYDGTLAPFQKQRDKARPYAGIEERLDKIISLNKTNIVIISGRAIEGLKPLLKLKKLPEIRGSHGRERLSVDGEYSIIKADERSARGLIEATKFIYDNHLDKFLESKPTSIAIHYRGVEPKNILEIRQKILDNWKKVGVKFNLECSEFDGGVELKIPGVNKGTAITEIFTVYPVNTIGAYLGDDLTDEDAFRALPASALGILVRKEPRDSSAAVRIKPPEELQTFLDRWIEIDQAD
jgi:trehalose 6-phosphate phosphatase